MVRVAVVHGQADGQADWRGKCGGELTACCRMVSQPIWSTASSDLSTAEPPPGVSFCFEVFESWVPALVRAVCEEEVCAMAFS